MPKDELDRFGVHTHLGYYDGSHHEEYTAPLKLSKLALINSMLSTTFEYGAGEVQWFEEWRAAVEAAVDRQRLRRRPAQCLEFRRLLPSPQQLALHAYFPAVGDSRLLRDVLEAAPGSRYDPARRYLVRWQSYFRDPEQPQMVARLDELCGPDMREIGGAEALPPPTLFRRIDEVRRLREMEALQRRRADTVRPFEWTASAPDITFPHPQGATGNVTLRVLRSEYEIVTVAQQLINCASNYVSRVRDRECILVAMYDRPVENVSSATALSLGMLEMSDKSEWSQLYGKRNMAVTEATRRCYEQARPRLAAWMAKPEDDHRDV